MNKIILDQKQRVNNWAYKKVGRESPFDKFNAFGVERRGKLIAGVIFDSFETGARCSMHCVGVEENWCSRELLYHCFNYVFNDAKCKVVINTVSSINESSITFTKHVGFTEVARIKDGVVGGDLVILVMHRENCKWLWLRAKYELHQQKAA